jgi:pyruvate dehydrogenase E2 component (dihydrolipoamide acetyltransferase)
MPKFGQMTEESAIVEWCKKEGDTVAKGDILFTVETDKSSWRSKVLRPERCSRFWSSPA